MANPTVVHASITGAAANPDALVDGPKWDAAHTVTGLENVDNTSDANKPISTATQTALNAKITGAPAALTRTSDTNVTLTLGGTPATAVLQATSITIGWAGTLAAGRGGFGADVSASSGVPLFATGVPTFTGTSGSGNFARVSSPTFTTPALGTPSAAVLTSATGLPLTTGVTGQLPMANGGTGTNLVDPNADRILFWDDSAGAMTFLTPGTGVSISGTTLNGTPPNTEVLYGADYGMVGDSNGTAGNGTDNTSAFNSFMAACKAGSGVGVLPKGMMRFASKPNDIDFYWSLGGKGPNGSLMLRDYNGSGTIGFLQYVAGANTSRLHDLAIYATSGTTAGSLIRCNSSSSVALSGLMFENLYLSTFGTDTYTNVIIFDGSAKTSAPIGIRDISLKNVHVFGANGYSVILYAAPGFSWMGGGVYPAGGTNAATGGINIGGTATEKSQYVTINITTCNGFNLTNSLDMQLISAQIGAISGVSVNNDSSCSFTCVYGHPAGTVASGWVSSGIRRPSAAWATS